MDTASEIARAYRAFSEGRHADAAECARRVLDRVPGEPAALTLIGRLALVAGEPEVAHRVASDLIHRHPDKAALWMDLALALRDLGRHREAADAAGRASTLDARDPGVWIRLGEILLSLDDRARAAAAFRRALALAPSSVAAYRGLCEAEFVAPHSDIARRMESLVGSSGLRPSDAAGLHYSLAQLYRRAGHRERFIHHLFAANATQRAECPSGRAEYAAIFDRLEASFTPEALNRAKRAGAIEPTPIFILGMPRSGTTLVERILAAHPDVASGGELDYMRRSLRRAVERDTGCDFPKGFEAISVDGLDAIARDFARRLGNIGRGSKYVTDKTPGNYHVLGLLRVLFPAGRVIHVSRDPLDTCFSILQHQFDNRSPHTCDIGLLAYAYSRYVRLMTRWRELFGGEFHTVEYEQLVESPAAEARHVFEYCGMEWSDEYLEFHRAGGAVRTFSASQVRRPIYRSSVGASREFADELAPLSRALEIELGGAPPG